MQIADHLSQVLLQGLIGSARGPVSDYLGGKYRELLDQGRIWIRARDFGQSLNGKWFREMIDYIRLDLADRRFVITLR